MKHLETIYFGQRAFKFEVSSELINNINNFVDKQIKEKSTIDGQPYLSAKIQNEYMITSFMNEIDTQKEIIKVVEESYKITWVDKAFKMKGLFMNSAWVNDQKQGEYQILHHHSGELQKGFSCIIFLKVPNFGKEYTHEDEPHNGRTHLIGNCGGQFNRNEYLIHPKVGDMYVFPYDMQHLVYPFRGKGIRRTMSMNFDYHVEKIKV